MRLITNRPSILALLFGNALGIAVSVIVTQIDGHRAPNMPEAACAILVSILLISGCFMISNAGADKDTAIDGAPLGNHDHNSPQT
ncbi:MAG TPA: hypothetical protein VFF84_07985 [Sphingobium sp.]|nr:hypothetical protein [Sphingobium sp.]